MFGNTQTIVIDGGNKVLTLINQDGYSAEYLLKATGVDYTLRISHSRRTDTKRKVGLERHTVEIVRTQYNADPAIPNIVNKSYIVLEVDNGVAVADAIMASNAVRQLLAVSNFQENIVGWQS